MSCIYFKNKQSFKKIINDSLKNNKITNEDIILLRHNKKYKQLIQKYTPINDDVINIINEYTIKEIKINIRCYSDDTNCTYIEIRCYKLFDILIIGSYYKYDDIFIYKIFLVNIKSNIINRIGNQYIINQNEEMIILNINDYKDMLEKESKKLNDYKGTNEKFVSQISNLSLSEYACDYVGFFNEYMKQNYDKENYIDFKYSDYDHCYYTNNNTYVMYYHKYEVQSDMCQNTLSYEIVRPLNHKKLKEIIVIMKLIITALVKELINHYKLHI